MALLQRAQPAGLARGRPAPTPGRVAACRAARRPAGAAPASGAAQFAPSMAPAARLAPQAPSRRLTVAPRAAASGAAATPAKPFKWCVGRPRRIMGGGAGPGAARAGQGGARGARAPAKWRRGPDPPTAARRGSGARAAGTAAAAPLAASLRRPRRRARWAR
jgi:hypothetical protein